MLPCMTARNWMGCWTRATLARTCLLTALIDRPRSRPNSGPVVTTVGFIDAVGAIIQSSAVFGANASDPRQEPDTRAHRACVRSAAERAGRSDRANDWHRAGARQDRLAEPGLQHSPPGDAGTARRGMKTVESSAVFQPKQWAEKRSPEDDRKQDLTRTCALEHCSRCPKAENTSPNLRRNS